MSEATAPLNGFVGVRAVRGGFPILAVLATALLLGALVVRALRLDRLGLSLCMFKGLTGFPCASCGTTRSAALLVAGDWEGALAMNPLATLSLVGLVVAGLADLVTLARGRALRFSVSRSAGFALRVVVPALIVANWLYLIAAGR